MRPRSSATPNSVTTLSTVFFIVVTTSPGLSCGTIRLSWPSLAVACSTMKLCPPSLYAAPRAKSLCPPDDE